MTEEVKEQPLLIDFAQVRQRVPLKGFVEGLGLTLSHEGDNYRCPCPIHGEQHGRSFIVYSNNKWFCHGKCATQYVRGGDVVDLAGILWGITNPVTIVERLLGEAPKLEAAQQRSAPRPPPDLKWPKRTLAEIDKIVRSGFGLYDTWEKSPLRYEDRDNHAEEIIDILFPGNPLLCIGETEWNFATQPREYWRGSLHQYPLMVANPMFAKIGLTRYGKPSEHTLDATAHRIYLPIECDFTRWDNNRKPTVFLSLIDGWELAGISMADACCAVLWHLKDQLPLVLEVHSGGKSVHGWFAAFNCDEAKLWAFMRRAYELGADRVTWTPSQFVRIPDGQRQDGKRQVTYYFDPRKAVRL
jgi:hypothetical protein